jgi:hypothetical protein
MQRRHSRHGVGTTTISTTRTNNDDTTAKNVGSSSFAWPPPGWLGVCDIVTHLRVVGVFVLALGGLLVGVVVEAEADKELRELGDVNQTVAIHVHLHHRRVQLVRRHRDTHFLDKKTTFAGGA